MLRRNIQGRLFSLFIYVFDSRRNIMPSEFSCDNVNVVCGDRTLALPVKKSAAGPSVMDVSRLYAETGMFTYDPGFVSTASCESSITFIDGQEGILRYRGYDVADLARHSSFIETAYLLLYGELPAPDELSAFSRQITEHTMVHEQLHFLLRGFPRRAHPMAVMSGAFASLSAFYHDSLDIADPEQRELSARRMVAKVATLAAMAYKYSIGQPIMHPQNKYGYTENFLYMTFAVPAEEYRMNPVFARALDVIFILHADHEQNASTSTVRLAGSSGANPFACIGAGIASLWGPAHGGANEAVIKMLKDIGDASRIPEFIARAKDKSDPFRLMGFGHRVYKNYDPRASVLRDIAHQVLKEAGRENDPMMEIAVRLEEIALEDPYFVEKKLYPNVDFYSGIIYQALGFPPQMFTVLFALARTVGWVAQWKEMIEDPTQKIGRPRQLYTGATKRDYPSGNKRAAKQAV